MRKNIVFIISLVAILAGCSPKQTMPEFTRAEVETTTFAPVNEQQHLSGYSQINIAELEGFENITEANIFIPIPNEAVWDANTKTYTMPNNYENENDEVFIMTISLESLPKDANYLTISNELKEEVEGLPRPRFHGSFYLNENNVVIKCKKETILEEPPEDGETTDALKKYIYTDITAYDFLYPTYVLNIEIDIVKQRGTVDDTSEDYINAVISAIKKLKIHYQED